MTYSLKDQINAIAEARAILEAFATIMHKEKWESLDARLNDAGSSLAALNLNPDREVRIKELEAHLNEIISLKDSALNTKGLFPCLQAIDRAKDYMIANLKFDAVVSGFIKKEEI